MIYRTAKEKIDEYYQNTGINQSAIKLMIQQGIQAFIAKQQEVLSTNERFQEDPEHFIIGGGIDSLITEGSSVFKERYHYNELLKKPAEKPMLIVKQLYDKLVVNREPYHIKENMKAAGLATALVEGAVEMSNMASIQVPAEDRPLHAFRKELYDLCNTVVGSDGKIGYYINNRVPSDKLVKGKPDERTWLDDGRVERLLGDGTCQAYWQDLIKAQGKQILTTEQYTTIINVTASILHHKFTGYLFSQADYESSDELDIVYQCILYWTEEVTIMLDGNEHVVDVLCKCMIDTLIFNHTRQWTIPLDVKTTRYPISLFHQQIRARRYDLQGSFYTRGIQKNLVYLSEFIGKDVSKYNIQNFTFVTESTVYTGTPAIFPLMTKLLEIGENGDEENRLKGWREILDIYTFWRANNFSIEKILEANSGVVFIDEEFKPDIIPS